MALPSRLTSPSKPQASSSSLLSSPRLRGAAASSRRSAPQRIPFLVQVTLPDHLVWLGTSTEARPARILAFPGEGKQCDKGAHSNSDAIFASVEAAYEYWAPRLQTALHSFLGQSSAADRPVVLVLPDAWLHEDDEARVAAETAETSSTATENSAVPVSKDSTTQPDNSPRQANATYLRNASPTVRAWHRLLTETLSVPSVMLVSATTVLPQAFPHLPTCLWVYRTTSRQAKTKGSNTAIQTTFTTYCGVHAHGQPLPFTRFTVTQTSSNDKSNDSVSLHARDPRSVVVAVGHALQACPVAVRKAAVQHILVLSTEYPSWSIKLGRRLRRVLETAGGDHDETDGRAEDPTSTLSPFPPSAQDYTYSQSPLEWATLQPLAAHVRIVDTGTTFPPDLWIWRGTTQWAAQQIP